MSHIHRRVGFTLIELLVVIAIIAVLIGLLLPAVQMARSSAVNTQCQNNLHQIGVALHTYHEANKVLPPGVVGSGSSTTPYWSWMALILPYMEQTNTYDEAYAWAISPANGGWNYWPWGDFWDSPNTPANPVLGMPQPCYRCPMDPRGETQTSLNNPAITGLNYPVAYTMYLGNAGTGNNSRDGVLYYDSKVRLETIGDGTSNTFLVGERPPAQDLNYGWWFAGAGWDGEGVGDVLMEARATNYASSLGCPTTKVGFQLGLITNDCDQPHYWSNHTGGGNFLMCDGSVRFLIYGADSILVALSTANGGEEFNMP